MKKLSALIALFLCVTIGGVYATWTYAGTTDITDGFAEAKVTITDAVSSGANGTYTVTSNLALSIDDKEGDHKAKLVFSGNDGQDPFIKVVFTPADHATKQIKENAVPTEIYFTTTIPMTYWSNDDTQRTNELDKVDIFTFTNPGDGDLNNLITWSPKQPDGTFFYTMDLAAIQGQIALTEEFFLDTKTEHDNFRAALAGNIVVKVTDGTVN